MAMLQHCAIMADSAGATPVYPVSAAFVARKGRPWRCCSLLQYPRAGIFSLSASIKDAFRKSSSPASASFFLMGHFLRQRPSGPLLRTLIARQGEYGSTSAPPASVCSFRPQSGFLFFPVRIPECGTGRMLTERKKFRSTIPMTAHKPKKQRCRSDLQPL